ncbi:hypothetical protein [Aureibacter tunicatorum]|uniref:Uncharacterized protein n=1 Tax=Aureibacter tunicatorum TaxID=866807 RepID=A0AAE4BQV9_9BACT|nr:hypothetical protein [Aureibacter tunicatorum]MDR6238001.1 hypothetical protein [Aureibacter tunicatorum]
MKPIDFRSQNGTLQLQIDFTVSTVDSDSVIVNFSVIKNDKEKLKFEEMLIQNGDSKLTLESPEYLYFEKRKKNYLSRYTAKCTTQQLIKLFESSKWVIGFNDNDSHFLPSKKFTKNCSILNEEVFSVYF